MTRLILTADSSAASAIRGARLGDLVIAIERRLVWGQLPSDAELEAFFAPRTTQSHGLHWRLEESAVKDRGLIDLSAEYDSIELWPGPGPNAQLLLLWLLDHCGRERAALSKLVMRQLGAAVGGAASEQFATLPPPIV